jgi:peptidoglycan/LPS O-acetylase OafA/YrhL
MTQAGGYFSFARKPGDSPWLDLVRAIAIALVLARHGYRAIAVHSEAPPDFWQALMLNGWVGVDLFFVLSGYLISRHLLRNGIGTGRFDFGRYVAMRALRIVPAYLAVMALILASAFPFYPIDRSELGFRVAYHVLFLQDYLPSNINIVFWSLGVEEKFYLLAPVLVWFALTRRSLAGSLIAIFALFALSPLSRAIAYAVQPVTSYEMFFQTLRSPFHMTLEPLMIGVAIAVAQRAGAFASFPSGNARVFAMASLTLAAFLATGDFMWSIGVFDAVVQPSIIALLCGLLTLSAVKMGDARLPFEPAVRVTARLSYCLYLVHFPLLPLAVGLSQLSAYRDAAFWIAFLSMSFIFAALLHFSVEKPFLILKDRLASSRRLAEAT